MKCKLLDQLENMALSTQHVHNSSYDVSIHFKKVTKNPPPHSHAIIAAHCSRFLCARGQALPFLRERAPVKFCASERAGSENYSPVRRSSVVAAPRRDVASSVKIAWKERNISGL